MHILISQIALSVYRPIVPTHIELYLDPGSGSFILQLVIASLIGIAVIVRAYWAKIKNLFHRGSSTPTQDDGDDE